MQPTYGWRHGVLLQNLPSKKSGHASKDADEILNDIGSHVDIKACI